MAGREDMKKYMKRYMRKYRKKYYQENKERLREYNTLLAREKSALKERHCECCGAIIDAVSSPRAGRSKRCYYCDTEYTHNFEFYKMAIKDAYEIIKKTEKKKCK